jgi:hypothetical protein
VLDENMSAQQVYSADDLTSLFYLPLSTIAFDLSRKVAEYHDG